MNNKIVVLLKIVVSIGLISFLVSQVNFKEIINIIKNLDLLVITFTVVLLTLQVFIAAMRWQLILNYQKIIFKYKNTLQILWIGLFFNQAMPSSVGGDVIRGYYVKANGITLGRATLAVLMDRLFGLFGLVITVLISIPLLFKLVNDPIARSGVLLIASGVSFALMFLLFTDKFPRNFSHFRVIKFFNSLSKDGRNCIIKNSNGLLIIMISVLIHLISVVSVITIAIGLGINIDWGGILLIVPLAGLMMVVPISIAGWGVREGVMVVGLGYLGVASEAALALSILYGLSMLAVAIPGGVIWALKRNHTSG